MIAYYVVQLLLHRRAHEARVLLPHRPIHGPVITLMSERAGLNPRKDTR